MDVEVGQVAGDYEILALLGAGGMGKVYKVRNTISERVEAMKVLLARLDEHPELVDRFSREIKVTATLDHPNIAALRTAQRIGNQLAMVMEYVEGSTLDTLMRTGPLPLAQVLEIVNQALSALAYAHSRGVVHRDIKPANIMVTPEGRVKLMDFGIARMAEDRSLTKTGQMVGSLYYMSPEQVEGKTLDARSDIYSLGITLYELVTGKKPFEGDSDYAILAGHLHQSPRPPIELSPAVPEGLNEIILMAMAKDPNQRFQTAAAFRGALNSVAAEMGIPLTAPSEGASSSRGAGSASNLVGTASNSGMGSAAPPPPMVDTVAGPRRPEPPVPPPPPPQPAPQQQYAPPPYQQTPAPAPVPAAGQSGRSGKRALWMIAGALATLVILAAGVIYLPKLRQAKANPAVQTQTASAQDPAPQPPSHAADPLPPAATPSDNAAQPVPTPVAQSPSAPSTVKKTQAASGQSRPATNPSTSPAPDQNPPPPPSEQQQPAANAQPAPDAANEARMNAELEKIQDELDLLGSRAGAIRSSLDGLQQQQAAQGYGLRGDIVASRQRMDTLMDQVQNRLRRGDPAGARKSLEAAEREVTKLEKFLGR